MPLDADITAQLDLELDGHARFDDVSRMLYRTDASIYEIEPVGVVLPSSAADVVHTTRWAVANGVSLLPRGAGTSLAGQAVGPCVHLDFSMSMHRILELNLEQRWVRVEPGMVLDHLNARLKRHGLVFGADVATSSRATIGDIPFLNLSLYIHSPRKQ